jgi:diguanylate cyclase (GGDEF)-like protein
MTEPSPPLTALIADDDRGILAILRTMLTRAGLEVVSAGDGTAAWDILCTHPPVSLAIIDWLMPKIDGLELCRRVRQSSTLSTMYVIILTARDGHANIVAGLTAGADDYISKPFDVEELKARVQVGIRVVTLQQRLSDEVAALQAARDALDRLASSDELTGLYSRRRWIEIATNEVGRYNRYRRCFSVLLADLDFFKRVNDTFGHAVGDEALKQFAQVLRDEARESDAVGRIGGEEFAILLPETTFESARDIGTRIVNACRTLRVDTPSMSVGLTCSIGVAEATPDDHTIESIVERADQEMYAAKRGGRDRVAPDRITLAPGTFHTD